MSPRVPDPGTAARIRATAAALVRWPHTFPGVG